MYLDDLVKSPQKFARERWDPSDWGIDRHGSIEFVLRKRQSPGVTSYAVVSATSAGAAGEPANAYVVDVWAGLEANGTQTNELVQHLWSALTPTEVETWFDTAIARAEELSAGVVRG